MYTDTHTHTDTHPHMHIRKTDTRTHIFTCTYTDKRTHTKTDINSLWEKSSIDSKVNKHGTSLLLENELIKFHFQVFCEIENAISWIFFLSIFIEIQSSKNFANLSTHCWCCCSKRLYQPEKSPLSTTLTKWYTFLT